jgi:Ca-activated chloride channel family protein
MTADFHFAQPIWLLGLLVPLLMWFLPPLRGVREERYKQYADPHLLPHLIVQQERATARRRRRFALWSALWALGCIALAGPRWDYEQVDLFSPGADLVVLFDLSRSMDAQDARPSRLARARQEVEDLLEASENLRVGIVGFASVAHVVAPITDDKATIRHLMPALSSDLVQLGGSRLTAALDRAERLLSGQPPGSVHALLLVSDGDFDEVGLEMAITNLAEQGVRLHVLGIGTPEGAPVPLPSARGGWVTDADGQRVISRLNEPLLRNLAQSGGGLYLRADYREADTEALLDAVTAGQGEAKTVAQGRQRIWHERYYWLVAVMLLLVLPWFRRGSGAAFPRNE